MKFDIDMLKYVTKPRAPLIISFLLLGASFLSFACFLTGIGCGGISGLLYMKYSTYHTLSSTQAAPGIIQRFSRSLNVPLLGLVSLALSLTFLDDLQMYSFLPSALFAGIFMIQASFLTRDLRVPLWYEMLRVEKNINVQTNIRPKQNKRSNNCLQIELDQLKNKLIKNKEQQMKTQRTLSSDW
ncbi:UNKNOWN [Stylonychia lemnae]|uniref:Transmembrane protein n=1 Tax=Stylonychia lemnae TaxID=5949 RepID=A0A078B0A5_STYLE|nr:UNKNOWN [Stylonychia lemnae]|eukprot:CDW88090.1 UNKNOWN [Stylonychia lemnae]